MPSFPLEVAKPSALGLNERALDRLQELITRHIAEGRYPGAQVAMARGGKLGLFASFGDARIEPRTAAKDDTLWLLYSNTKVITACAVWLLAEQGALSFTDTVAVASPGLRGPRQGRHHHPPAPHAPGRIPERGDSRRGVDGSRSAAAHRVRHHAGVDAGLPGAVPRPPRRTGWRRR